MRTPLNGNDPTTGDFAIDIDPSLIEEALAAVDRRHADGAPAADDAADALADLEVELDAPPPPAPREDEEERRRLQFRVQEQTERIRRLEQDLGRATEMRDGLDRQVRELRKAHGELTADFERFRARARKDIEEAERRGEERALAPLVEVSDNVERAWTHAGADPARVVDGLQMIVDQFRRMLGRLGFERIEAGRGTPFDPSCHEAVLHVHADDVATGGVVDEVQAGFRLRGRLFRPSRVTVAAPSNATEPRSSG